MEIKTTICTIKQNQILRLKISQTHKSQEPPVPYRLKWKEIRYRPNLVDLRRDWRKCPYKHPTGTNIIIIGENKIIALMLNLDFFFPQPKTDAINCLGSDENTHESWLALCLCLGNQKILMNTVDHYSLKNSEVWLFWFFLVLEMKPRTSHKLDKALSLSCNQTRECLQRTNLCL